MENRESKNANDQLREEAVRVLYDSLKSKHNVLKEQCYIIYDKMQKANERNKNG